MREEMKKNETRVQKYDLASQIIRIKKKRKKRDLDQVRSEVLNTRNKSRQRYSAGKRLHCNIKNSLRKTTNTFTRGRQNNVNQTNGSTRKDREQIKQKTLCERLLPQPCIGIYRNGTSGKQIKKQNKIYLSESNNERRLSVDVMKLLNGEGHLFKKCRDVKVFEENELISCDMRPPTGFEANKNNSPRVTMIEAELEKGSIGDEEQVNLINRMNTLGKECLKSSDRKCYCCKVLDSPPKDDTLRSTPTGNNEIVSNGLNGLQHSSLHRNLETSTNAEIQSVGRWRCSPVTCFEEFCCEICLQHFVNCPIDGFVDPIERSKMILKDLYLENNNPDCVFYASCKDSDNSIPKIADNKSSPNKMKQNNVDGRWYMNHDIIPDWMTPESKNESIEDTNVKFTVKTTINEVAKEKRGKFKLSMPIKAENSTNCIEIPKNYIKCPSKIEKLNFPLNKANHSIKYGTNYEKFDDFSHRAISSGVGKLNDHYHLDIPSITNLYVNESLENGKYQIIETPSVVYRIIRDNKSPKLNHTKAIDKEKKRGNNKDKTKDINCEKFEIPKGILKNVPDKVSHQPNDRSSMYVERNKSNDTKFYGDFSRECFAKKSCEDNQCTLHNKLKGRSEKSGEIPQFELFDFVKNNAHRESIDKSLHFRSDYPKNWQNTSYNNKHDYKMEGKVFSLRDDYFDQVIDQPIGNKKLKHSRQTQQPTKYFAVKNNHNSVDFPQRIAIYPHEYPYNYNDSFHCSAVRRPYYQSVDNRQVIEPSLIDTRVGMFNPEKYLYDSKFHTVDAVNKQQDERSELSRRTLWINNQVGHFISPKSCNNHKSNRNYQSQIDHNKSYYFH